MKIIVVVFWKDLPQFAVFCYCLNRFWTGKKSIKIIVSNKVNKEHNKDITRVNSKKILQQVNKITSKHLIGWDCEIKLGQNNFWAAGWDEQQIYKVVESANLTCEESIVLDCKDWLIKPFGLSDLKTNEGQYLIKIYPDTSELPDRGNFYANAVVYLNSKDTRIPENLTPWIWNNYDVKKFLEFIEKKEQKSLIDCEFFPGQSEIECFYVYQNLIKKKKSIYINNEKFNNLIINLTKNETCQVKNYYSLSRDKKHKHVDSITNGSFKIFKVHRNSLTHAHRLFVADIMRKLIFPKEVIDDWFNSCVKYQTNWQSHGDLIIEMYKNRITD